MSFRYKYSVLILTFITYVAYHASRKPISVVKSVLYQNCSDPRAGTPPINNTNPDWCNWAPFGKSYELYYYFNVFYK